MVAAAALGRQRYETTERMIRQRAIERLTYQRHTGRANKSESSDRFDKAVGFSVCTDFECQTMVGGRRKESSELEKGTGLLVQR